MKILSLLIVTFLVCSVHGLAMESQQTLSELKTFVDLVATQPKDEDSFIRRRELTNKLFIDLSGTTERVKTVQDFYIANQLDAHPIPVRLYANDIESRKVMLFVHGGGNILGNLDTHDYLCRKIAKIFNLTVASVEYRLAPEYRFPAPLEDIFSVYWYLSSVFKDVFVSGDSTGGSLAAALCVQVNEKKITEPSALMLMYPLLSNEFSASCQQFENTALSLQDIEVVTELYTGLPYESEEVSKNKLIFPALEKDVTVFPRTCLVSAKQDVLLEQQNTFRARLERAGIDNTQITVDGAIHGFMTCGKYFDARITEVLMACRECLFR